MCDAGRIKHHLKHNLWREECCIVFTGFQASGTLGRAIVDGNKSVKILGEDIAIKAKIFTLGGFSGHADQKGLISWVSNFRKKKKKMRPGLDVGRPFMNRAGTARVVGKDGQDQVSSR